MTREVFVGAVMQLALCVTLPVGCTHKVQYGAIEKASSRTIEPTRNTSAAESDRKPAGAVSIESIPPRAEVYIGSRYVGQTPVASVRLFGKRVLVRVVKAGYKEWIRSLSVMGGHQRVKARLVAKSSSDTISIIAVFNVEARRVKLKASVLAAMSDYLGNLIAQKGTYRVVPRDDLKRRLVGQKLKSYRHCYDQSCQIEIGRELAAHKSLSTLILRLGGKCRVTATVYDLLTATAEYGVTAEGDCTEEGITASLQEVAAGL